MEEALFRKLQLLSTLSVRELGNVEVPIDPALLDDILARSATCATRIRALKDQAQGSSRQAQSPSRTVAAPSSHMEPQPHIHSLTSSVGATASPRRAKIGREKRANTVQPKSVPRAEDERMIQLLQWRGADGLARLFCTSQYEERWPDGSLKSVTVADINRHNFAAVFRQMLTRLRPPPSWPSMGRWPVLPPSQKTKVALLAAPEESSAPDVSYGEMASVAAVSLYPHCRGRPYREGDPVCDRVHLVLYSAGALLVLTDGCNWGEKPRKASRYANKAILAYLSRYISSLTTVTSAVHLLLAALTDGHLNIISHSEELWMGCTTTALAGLILQVDQAALEELLAAADRHTTSESAGMAPTPFVFVCANIGDCRVLHYCRRTGAITSVTCGSRTNALDATDPGGRLGSFRDGWPDLRNLSAFWLPVEEGDIVMGMSDGIYDNLDPQLQGLVPRDLGLAYANWEGLSAVAVQAVKRTFIERFVEQRIVRGDPRMTPKKFKDRLLEHCTALTAKTREHLSGNPNSKITGNYREFPGKLDHSSVAAVRVGKAYRWDEQVDEHCLYPVLNEKVLSFAQEPARGTLADSQEEFLGMIAEEIATLPQLSKIGRAETSPREMSQAEPARGVLRQQSEPGLLSPRSAEAKAKGWILTKPRRKR